jgi:DNA anti-recombination protein RmuC
MLVKDKVEVLEQRLQDEKAKRAQLEQSHKLELEQSRAQVQELGKQIEKSARDYQKLMGKIDEDSEETAHLRETVRS